QRVSRADLALDVVGLNVETLQDVYENDQFITRARSTDSYNNRVLKKRTGFQAGKPPCRLVVYDKLYETARKSDTEYLEAMVARRWGNVLPSAATRIEWQLRRQKLR